MLEALSDNVEENISSSLINLCHYIAEYCEDEFVSAIGDSGLTVSCLMSAIKIASMMNDIGINISQLYILLRKIRHKIGAKLFEPESKMTDLYGETIVPQLENINIFMKLVTNQDLFYTGFVILLQYLRNK